MAGKVIDVTLQLVDRMTGPLERAGSKLAAHANQYVKAGRQIQNAGKGIHAAGASFTKSMTVPIVAAGTAAVRAASEFESGMDKVRSISGTVSGETLDEVMKAAGEMGLSFKKGADDTETAMNILSAQAKKMGSSLKYSAGEATEAYQYMGMAGWDAGDMLHGIEPIMKLCGATGEDLARGADIVTDALTAFGMSSRETGKFVDILAKTSSSANTDVSMLGESFKYVAPVAGSLGYTAADTSKMLGIMADSGIKASSAGTGLRSVLSRMASPTKDVQGAMDALGLSLTDEKGKMKSLDALMGEMRGSFGKLTETQKAQYAASIAGKSGMSGLLAIVDSSDAEWDKMTEAMENASGAADEMYRTANDNLNGQLTVLKSTVESIAISFGERLAPYVKAAAGQVQRLADRFCSLSEAQQDTVIRVLLVAASIGPALFIFGKMVTGIGRVVSTVGRLGKAIRAAGSVMGLITSPAGIVIAVVAALALAAVLVARNWDKVRPVLLKVKDVFSSAFGGAGGIIQTFRKEFSQVVRVIGDTIRGLVPVLSQAGQVLLSAFGGAVRMAVPLLGDLASMLMKMLPEAVKLFSSALQAVIPAVGKVAGQILSGLVPVFRTVGSTAGKTAPVIGKTFVKAWQALLPVFRAVMRAAGQLAPVVGSVLVKAFRTMLPIVTAAMRLLTKIAGVIGDLLVHMVEKAGPVIERLAVLFSVVFQKAYRSAEGFLGKLRPVFSMVGSVITSAMKLVAPAVGHAFRTAGKLVSDAVSFIGGLFGSLMDTFGGLIDFITGVFTGNWSKAWNGVVSIFRGIFNLIPLAVEKVINGVVRMLNSLTGGINRVTGAVGVPEIPEIPTVSLPRLAAGTGDWRGGLVQISERGGEIVDLPKGSRVYPHDRSVEMARQDGRREAGRQGGQTVIKIVIPKLADRITVREESDIDRIAQALADRLEKVAGNMGGGEIEHPY